MLHRNAPAGTAASNTVWSYDFLNLEPGHDFDLQNNDLDQIDRLSAVVTLYQKKNKNN